MPSLLTCLASGALILAVWIPQRRRYPLTWLRIVVTALLLVVTALGLEVLHELRGLDAIGRTSADAFERATAR